MRYCEYYLNLNCENIRIFLERGLMDFNFVKMKFIGK